ncbi:unnamed protein product [Prorocentrum cordatum]|uniref:Uncharacterized protein n=1 Tax=Prorocentrum cordatum TaxID=2364126 RepID=A0ABN9YAB0_9DINO|nr:unnamed protein product [Polarella glacialis]
MVACRAQRGAQRRPARCGLFLLAAGAALLALPRRGAALVKGQCAAGVRREPVDAPVDDKQLLIVGGCDLLLLSAGTVAARGFRARPSLAILAAVAVYVVFLVLVMRILQTSPL